MENKVPVGDSHAAINQSQKVFKTQGVSKVKLWPRGSCSGHDYQIYKFLYKSITFVTYMGVDATTHFLWKGNN